MDKNHRVISPEAEKAFNKIQCPFIIETLNKLGIAGNFLNQIKGMNNAQLTSYLLNGERFTQNKTGMVALATNLCNSTLC